MRHQYSTGIFWCILGATCWGSIGIFVKSVLGIHPVAITFFRLLIAFMGICLLISNRKKWQQITASLRYWKQLIAISMLLGGNFLFSVTGFTLTTVANGSLLNNTTALFTPLLALSIQEKTSIRQLGGIVIGSLGIGFIFMDQGISFQSEYFLGNFFAVTSALFLSAYIVFCKKISKNFSWETLLFWAFGGGTILCGIMLLLFQIRLLVSPENSLPLFGLGIIGTLLGHTFFNIGLTSLKSNTSAMLTLLSPVAAIFFALVFLKETPSFTTILGGLLSFCGITIALLHQKRSLSPAIISK